MHGVLEEKTSRVVEVLISSVRPFYLLMGKVMGIAAVGLSQLLIWVVLMTVLTTAVLSYFGLSNPSNVAMESVMQNVDSAELAAAMPNPDAQHIVDMMASIPFGMLAFTFIFYFVGGYLLYGAMFAAVGSAVDSQSDAQQFMFPITIPIIIAFIGLSVFILNDPDSSVSFWLSIIPFTSPIAMMGRISFGLPLWELLLSMALLIGGFIFTIWVASRIYRIGILTHGSKVSYKVLMKWIMMKY
jgi:ABC-2 type transport system permease protein